MTVRLVSDASNVLAFPAETRARPSVELILELAPSRSLVDTLTAEHVNPPHDAWAGFAREFAFQARTLEIGHGRDAANLEETVTVLRRLLDGERVTFRGKHLQLEDALCEPRPVQQRLRLWIGGQGERRLLRMVARHADGWNVPFLSPELYAMRNGTLNDWCAKERRDPQSIVRTCNVGLAIGEDEARARQQEDKLQLMFGVLTDFVKPGHLIGTPAQVRDRVGEYARAGAEWLILALRAPFDWEGLDLFISEVMPAFR